LLVSFFFWGGGFFHFSLPFFGYHARSEPRGIFFAETVALNLLFLKDKEKSVEEKKKKPSFSGLSLHGLRQVALSRRRKKDKFL